MQHDFILLDRSGSMASRWDEAIASVNAYVGGLALAKVDTGVTLAVFDTSPSDGRLDFVVIRDRIIPSTWHNVSATEVTPRNGTPLNDAAARIISLAEQGNYSKVSIIIMTDGEENSSREYSTAQIKARLDDCRKRDWIVTFLGANFDNARQAASYGTSTRNTVSMAKGMHVNSMGKMAAKRATYASGVVGQSAATMDWADDEKDEVAPKPTA